MTFVEKTIREIISKAIKSFAKKNNVSEKDVQIRFHPFVDGSNIDCRYSLYIDYKHKEELSYQDVAGIWYFAVKEIIEKYMQQLYILINKNENIDLKDIRISIQATKENFEHTDLVAYLYENSKIKRKLDVSEFVGEE